MDQNLEHFGRAVSKREGEVVGGVWLLLGAAGVWEGRLRRGEGLLVVSVGVLSEEHLKFGGQLFIDFFLGRRGEEIMECYFESDGLVDWMIKGLTDYLLDWLVG